MKLTSMRFVNILTPKNISVACKPSSVLCNHLSGVAVAYNFQRFFRASRTSYSSIRILHQVGFTSTISYHIVGKLLPYLSTLTEKRRYISVALSLKSPLPVISRHSVLWCSDFPHFAMRLLGHLMLSNNIIIRWLKSQCIRQYKIDFSNKNVQHTLHINN